MKSYKHFTTLVIGEKPEDMIRKYDKALKVERYVLYDFSNAANYRNSEIKVLEALAARDELKDSERELVKERLAEVREMDDTDFYIDMIEDREMDEETGNVYSTENPNGMYDGCKSGKSLSVPFTLKDGTEAFSARKSEVDWEKSHLYNQRPYEVAWETVMEGRKPETPDEEKIYNNMKFDRKYFEYYGTKERYVANSTAFWAFAVVNEKGEWEEVKGDQTAWVIGFFDKYIKPLPEDTLLSIFECTRF